MQKIEPHVYMNPNELPFELIVDQLNDGVLIVSFSGAIIYVNRQMTDILGYTGEEMYGHQLFEFMNEEWAERARVNLKRRAAGAEERFDHQFLHKKGHVIWAMVSTRPIELDDGKRISLVAIRDITKRIEAETELKRMKEELEDRVRKRTQLIKHEVQVRREAERLALEASDTKSRLLANMSHELRTPLNAILGYTEILLEEHEELSGEEITTDLERIFVSSRHLLDLINDVLNLAKLESGHESIRFDVFKPSQLVHEVAQMLAPLIHQRQNMLTIEIEYDGEVSLDRLKLKQILVNLLSNAAKFTQGGTITIRLSQIGVGDRSGISLDIEDTGEGIAQQDVSHLFQPFVQSSSASYKHKSGTGLGLAITKQYCEMMRGQISVTSTLGQGSHFIVQLPGALDPITDQGDTP